MWRIAKSDYVKLVPVLALAYYIAFIPHLNYSYPLHVDEWVHLAFSDAMAEAQGIKFVEPFYGQGTIALSSNLEVGFNLFWSVFHQISGITWLSIFRYFPGIILIIIVLSVYVLARRQGFGWEAAFCTCLILTTLGILGPAFLVPVAMGLVFIPLSIFIVFNFKTGWSYLTLFIFTSFLFAMHAATAVGLFIILAPYILLNLKGNFRHSLCVTLALILPFLGSFPWIFDMLILPTAQSLLEPAYPLSHVDIPRVIASYGYFPCVLAALGTFVLAMRGVKKSYGLTLGLLALLIMLVAFFVLQRGVPIMYERGLMYMMLMLSIVAGAGLMAIKNLKLPAKLGAPRIIQRIGYPLCIALIVVILVIGIPSRQNISYYQMIDEEDYEAFVWIRDHIDDTYRKAILDPWKATAFTAITGKNIYIRIHETPGTDSEKAYKFLRGGCSDTAFLRAKEISIVYSQWPCSNPDLLEVRKNVYLLKEAGDW